MIKQENTWSAIEVIDAWADYHYKQYNNKMNGNWSNSFDKPTQRHASPLGVYFPFGEERQKIKDYVFEQLHGNSTLQNEEILKKFREEATIRRHHHLHRLSYTEQTP